MLKTCMRDAFDLKKNSMRALFFIEKYPPCAPILPFFVSFAQWHRIQPPDSQGGAEI